MKVRLLYPGHDFDPEQKLPWQGQALEQDLGLDTLWRSMSGGDPFIFDVARKVLLSGQTTDLETVAYRQELVNDCLRNPAVVRQLYDLTVEAIDKKKKKFYFGFFSRFPGGILQDAIEVMGTFMASLKSLRALAEAHAGEFTPRGFSAFFSRLREDLSDAFFAEVQVHLSELRFDRGVLVSAALGQGNAGTACVLRSAREERLSWLARIFGKGPPAYTYHVPERDESGSRALAGLRDRGINLVANALAQSTDHILDFFDMLRTELAFYIGCLNLYDELTGLGVRTCLPRPTAPGTRKLRFSGLSDPSLGLVSRRSVVPNDLNADGKSLIIVTGANQGGKTTFLRSVGLAQLMMQGGLFVAAEIFEAELCAGLFTHFRREEDVTMTRGKLDAELDRMSEIVDALRQDALLLFNESFSGTNEREGSEIAGQIVRALLESRMKVAFVTHLYEFAHDVVEGAFGNAIFLRAERRSDGTRTFRIVEGEPQKTSYGEDLYRRVFGGATEGRGMAEVPADDLERSS